MTDRPTDQEVDVHSVVHKDENYYIVLAVEDTAVCVVLPEFGLTEELFLSRVSAFALHAGLGRLE